jgi:hypothetical protein
LEYISVPGESSWTMVQGRQIGRCLMTDARVAPLAAAAYFAAKSG